MPRRGAARLRVRFDEEALALDLARYRPGSRAREVAERTRTALLRTGVSRAELVRCAAEGRDGTRLAGCLKVYLPFDAPQRPFRMVFMPGAGEDGLELVYLAYGVGHQPAGSRAPTAYAIAHRRLHGQWPR